MLADLVNLAIVAVSQSLNIVLGACQSWLVSCPYSAYRQSAQGKTLGSQGPEVTVAGKAFWNPLTTLYLLDSIVSEFQRIVLSISILSSPEFSLDSSFRVSDKLYLHIRIK